MSEYVCEKCNKRYETGQSDLCPHPPLISPIGPLRSLVRPRMYFEVRILYPNEEYVAALFARLADAVMYASTTSSRTKCEVYDIRSNQILSTWIGGRKINV